MHEQRPLMLTSDRPRLYVYIDGVAVSKTIGYGGQNLTGETCVSGDAAAAVTENLVFSLSEEGSNVTEQY